MKLIDYEKHEIYVGKTFVNSSSTKIFKIEQLVYHISNKCNEVCFVYYNIDNPKYKFCKSVYDFLNEEIIDSKNKTMKKFIEINIIS